MTRDQFVERIAASDVTAGDLSRLRTSALYGRILTKVEREEVSQTLGVLRDILAEARRLAAEPTP